MGVKIPDLEKRTCGALSVSQPDLPLGSWEMRPAAQVISTLLHRDFSPEQVIHRAVALGLLRCCQPVGRPRLTNQTASRLFLAGFGLPAQVEIGSLATIKTHLTEGRQVFVLLQDRPDLSFPLTEPGDQHLLQAQALLQETDTEVGFLLTDPDDAPLYWYRLPRDQFEAAWAANGNLLVAALRDWDHLPNQAPTFFGGFRNPDGSYFWETAECDTDCKGQVLRC
jgi:hypothetical protein